MVLSIYEESYHIPRLGKSSNSHRLQRESEHTSPLDRESTRSDPLRQPGFPPPLGIYYHSALQEFFGRSILETGASYQRPDYEVPIDFEETHAHIRSP